MTMRIGLAGTGPWAARVHGPAARAHPDVTLTSVWGRDPGRAARMSAALGVPAAGSFEDLVAAVDAVIFAVPPDAQAPLAVKAARAGRHLLLEKPIAFTAGQGAQIESAVSAAGVRALVFFTHLWIPETRRWIASLAAEPGWDRGRVDMISSVLRGDSPFGRSPWRRERGGLWDLGPHAVALLRTVLGPVELVTARRTRHGLSHLILEHAGGASSTVATSLSAHIEDRYQYLFEGHRVEAPAPAGPPDIDTAVAAARHALAALAAGPAADAAVPPPPGISLGAEVLRVILAAEESAARNVTIPLAR